MRLTGRMLTGRLGPAALRRFGVRFAKQVWPGDRLTAKGQVTTITEKDGQQSATIHVVTVNRIGETVVEGEAVAAL